MRPVAKQEHRALFLALQADAKGYPGGIAAVANAIGINPTTLANCVNPDHEGAPPSMGVFLEMCVLVNARRTAFAVAQMMGQVTIDAPAGRVVSTNPMKEFMELLHEISSVMAVGTEAASDLRLSVAEQRKLIPLVQNLICSAGEFVQSINGGHD